jgi:hypothetical protein
MPNPRHNQPSVALGPAAYDARAPPPGDGLCTVTVKPT